MPRVVHFEIHAADPEKMAAFYRSVFEWKINKMEGMEYWMVETGDASEPGINGGLMQRRGPKPSEPAVNAHVCTVQVNSVDTYWKRSMAAGGTVAMPKMAIPGVGFVAYIKDPDGNIFGLFQPSPDAKP